MNNNKMMAVGAQLTKLFVAFNMPSANDLQAAIWFEALEEYSSEQIERGVRTLIKEYKYQTPKPSDLIAQIQLSKEGQLMAAEAALMSATRLTSGRVGVAFEDPAIHIALQSMGGWGEAYAALTDKTDVSKRLTFLGHFERAYVKALACRIQHPAFLPGLGVDKEALMLVGDQDAVVRTLRSGYNPLRAQPALAPA